MNTRILINDLCVQAEALAQDLRTLQEHEKPEKWAKERAAHARGEPVQFNLPHVWNEEIWEDWLGRSAPDFERTDMKWRIKPSPEWTPKFKVGDRVKIITPLEKATGLAIIEIINKGVYRVAEPGETRGPCYMESELALEPAPLPDTERGRFERWARDYYTMTPISWESDIKQYEPTHVHGAWVAWQAARKAQ